MLVWEGYGEEGGYVGQQGEEIVDMEVEVEEEIINLEKMIKLEEVKDWTDNGEENKGHDQASIEMGEVSRRRSVMFINED